jgi:hypothetical protein
VRAGTLAHDEEGVERVAVARGVDLGLGDVEAGTLEIAADAREQRLAVGGVDHHLQPLADGREARLDHRRRGIDAIVQAARLPGDFLRVVAQEVGRVELRPEARLDFVGQRIQAQQPRRFFLLLRQRRVQRRRVARKHAPRRAEQVLEQLRLPGVPYLRAGTADVGDREEVERHQAPLAADQFRKGAHHLGIVHVLLLRGSRHCQVMLDEEGGEFRIFARQAVAPAEGAHVAHAVRGVVAAAALGEVVVERGDVQQPAGVAAVHLGAAQG